MVSLIGFITLILAYGVLIPNRARRCAVVVGALALVALGCWALVGLREEVLPRLWSDYWGYALRTLTA